MKTYRILLICPYFPPSRSVAAHRISAFANYLGELGHSVTVLCADENVMGGNRVEGAPFGKIIRVSSRRRFDLTPILGRIPGKVGRYLGIVYTMAVSAVAGDEYFAWRKRCGDAIRWLRLDSETDVVLSSYAPVSSHRLAYTLKRRYPDLIWVADMRDEMAANPFVRPLIKILLRIWEKRVLAYCNAVTSVSEPVLATFRKRQSAKNGHGPEFVEIRNGYDFTSFPDSGWRNEFFSALYAGSFYGSIKPDALFEALCSIPEEVLSRVRIDIASSVRNYAVPERLRGHVRHIGEHDHETAIQLMRSADALIMIHPNNGRKGVYTGKLFEYLGVHRPIVAIVDPDDVAAGLIRECRAGFVGDSNDPDSIRKAFLDCYELWRDGRRLDYNEDKIESLHRKYQVRKMSALIASMASDISRKGFQE